MDDDLGWTQDLAYGALLGTTVAACVIPTAWPVVGTMYGYQCNPGEIITAAHRWEELAAGYGRCGAPVPTSCAA
jgi:hypothetical protein